MNSVIEKKLNEYNPLTQDDYKNALKEMLQNIILVALKKEGFLKKEHSMAEQRCVFSMGLIDFLRI